MTRMQNFTKGFIKENPILVFLLGLCPALATTRTLEAALGMGILVIIVLVSSNTVVSLLKNVIPNEIRIPSYIVIIATFVTIVKMLTDAFAPALANTLGIFIPLIVVNCLILGRAEAFASKNSVFDSIIDGLGMGLGFTFAMLLIGFFREFIGTGAITYGAVLPLPFEGKLDIANDFAISVFRDAPGAFIVLGLILAIVAAVQNRKEAK